MADIDRLLVLTSRTFALAIPLLPEPLRREVGVAYLLFRIADSFEDATRWPQSQRVAALGDLMELLRAPSREASERLAAGWVAAKPCDHAGYLELLAETPKVLAELERIAPSRSAAIVRHTIRTAEGMTGFVGRGGADGSFRLATLSELRRYCYVVAGIVGELLTELFLEHAPELDGARRTLERSAVPFGEGLQLVNILKDAGRDARDGRVYLPEGVDRHEIFAIARDDLRAAADYVLALQTSRAPLGLVAFTALPVLLARATLDHLERSGAGSSISRAEVAALMGRLERDLSAGAPALS